MRVLVAGDRGYIGAVLVPFVRAAGHDVVGLDVGWYDGCDFGPQPNGYEQRTGDIRDVLGFREISLAISNIKTEIPSAGVGRDEI